MRMEELIREQIKNNLPELIALSLTGKFYLDCKTNILFSLKVDDALEISESIEV